MEDSVAGLVGCRREGVHLVRICKLCREGGNIYNFTFSQHILVEYVDIDDQVRRISVGEVF